MAQVRVRMLQVDSAQLGVFQFNSVRPKCFFSSTQPNSVNRVNPAGQLSESTRLTRSTQPTFPFSTQDSVKY
ncbi:hypothetical protein Hdeb2414_s0001g00000191 [Helianthus debilis subsp. tardiflorus]